MQKGQSREEEPRSRQSTIGFRTTVITRSDPTKRGSSVFSRGSTSFQRSTPTLSAATFQQLSSSGITDFKGSRQKEKKEFQQLNERLANYIQRVNFLDAEIKRLEAENEALRNRKMGDLQPIRDAYENELTTARKVIDEMSCAKGKEDAKIAGLVEDNADLRRMITELENQVKDGFKKNESFCAQIGEYEGELETLRKRVSLLEDENTKLRDLNNLLKDQNARLRSDLDNETSAHIEADCIAQTKTEECDFLKDLLDQLELTKPEPLQIKGMNYADFWKSEMARSIREINNAYDEKIDMIQQDCEAKYAAQLNSMKAGNVKDGMQLAHAQEETTKLRSQLADRNAALADLTSRIAALQAEKDDFAARLSQTESELDETESRYRIQVQDLQEELTSVLAQLQALLDTKMSLELEIACYKKLLEGEESRVGLRTLVTSALGAQQSGAALLKDTIQRSS